jgi:hypothetical protein
MGTVKPELKESNIVLLGDFNPKIFQPAWFAAEGLIARSEADKADIKIIHADLVGFSLEWLQFEVTRERLVAGTTQDAFDVVVRDLVRGTFNLLRHTPIRQMGINRIMHFRVESEDVWHDAGHKLAPKEIWQGVLDKAGLLSLSMIGYDGRDDKDGRIRVKVGPSPRVRPGLCFDVNDHFQVRDPDKVIGCDEMMGIIETTWTISYKRSESIMYSLLERLLWTHE